MHREAESQRGSDLPKSTRLADKRTKIQTQVLHHHPNGIAKKYSKKAPYFISICPPHFFLIRENKIKIFMLQC
jgi:hypothetical protein